SRFTGSKSTTHTSKDRRFSIITIHPNGRLVSIVHTRSTSVKIGVPGAGIRGGRQHPVLKRESGGGGGTTSRHRQAKARGLGHPAPRAGHREGVGPGGRGRRGRETQPCGTRGCTRRGGEH